MSGNVMAACRKLFFGHKKGLPLITEYYAYRHNGEKSMGASI
ncbi:MAG: hypothetical protein DESF_00304 [Desulfovibrio sp.]